MVTWSYMAVRPYACVYNMKNEIFMKDRWGPLHSHIVALLNRHQFRLLFLVCLWFGLTLIPQVYAGLSEQHIE